MSPQLQKSQPQEADHWHPRKSLRRLQAGGLRDRSGEGDLRYNWVSGNSVGLEVLFSDVNAIRTFWAVKEMLLRRTVIPSVTQADMPATSGRCS